MFQSQPFAGNAIATPALPIPRNLAPPFASVRDAAGTVWAATGREQNGDNLYQLHHKLRPSFECIQSDLCNGLRLVGKYQAEVRHLSHA